MTDPTAPLKIKIVIGLFILALLATGLVLLTVQRDNSQQEQAVTSDSN